MANRRCARYGIWELFNALSCGTTAVTNGFRNISTVSTFYVKIIICCTIMQVDVTINNVVAVSNNLSDLITSTTDTADQNTDNIIVVSGILNQTASVLSDSTILTALSYEEVSMV